MRSRVAWTRQQLLVAFSLYCKIPFGRLHQRNSEIIKYAALIGRTPSALAMKLTNIASLDPAITATGRKGLKGASRADRQMWEEMQNDWDRFVTQSEKAIQEVLLKSSTKNNLIADEQNSIEELQNYTGENKIVSSKVRVGQDFFRRAVLSAYENKCCITGLSVRQLLVASHIVPWGIDKKNRLNPRNGLSLSMLHDKAFDSGLITIDRDMKVCVSSKISISESDKFFISALRNYHGLPIVQPEKFNPHEDFLIYHRENIFEKSF
ncbi:MAG TPA: HNH endonuclease [Desulfobulbaceae bacterium]|nr:HNH endonuclease [Desulfobulbaceae bacterium]